MKKILAAFLSILLTVHAFSENIGLVLSGGGAKGAYEVGVWKALQEYGLDLDVKLISGASVGALNAGLFACTTSDEAKTLWENEVGFSSFLMPDINNIKGIGSALVTAWNSGIGKEYAAPEEENKDDFLENLKSSLVTAGNVGTEEFKLAGNFIMDYCLGENHVPGLFTRDALREILNRYISIEKLNKSGIEVYATTLRKEYLAVKGLSTFFIDDYSHNFKLNDQLSDQNARDIMLASSALPLVYESQFLGKDIIENGKKINKEFEYIDGGFEAVGGKNTPYRPAAASKEIDTVFVVYLKTEEQLKEDARSGDGKITSGNVRGKKLVHFIPSEDLGNLFTGVINFSSDKIDVLIDLGYRDAIKVLRHNNYEKMDRKLMERRRARKAIGFKGWD